MIEYSNGSIFDADVEVLVNPVNCIGVMGAGLAKEFKVRYPLHHMEYVRACEQFSIVLGSVYPIRRAQKMIVMFPTKRHWEDSSNLKDIKRGISDLAAMIISFSVQSIAIPALGCGLGGLNWSDVLPIMLSELKPLRDVRIIIYPPHELHDSISS